MSLWHHCKDCISTTSSSFRTVSADTVSSERVVLTELVSSHISASSFDRLKRANLESPATLPVTRGTGTSEELAACAESNVRTATSESSWFPWGWLGQPCQGFCSCTTPFRCTAAPRCRGCIHCQHMVLAQIPVPSCCKILRRRAACRPSYFCIETCTSMVQWFDKLPHTLQPQTWPGIPSIFDFNCFYSTPNAYPGQKNPGVTEEIYTQDVCWFNLFRDKHV